VKKMVHKSILKREDKKQYEEGFKSGFEGDDLGFFKNQFYQEGWEDGINHREAIIINEKKSLRKKLYKKYKEVM
jgi:hypothetical protein